MPLLSTLRDVTRGFTRAQKMGGGFAFLCGALLFLLMSNETQGRVGNFHWGGWLGFIAAFGLAFSVTAALGHTGEAKLSDFARVNTVGWRQTWLGPNATRAGVSPLITLPIALVVTVVAALFIPTSLSNTWMPVVIALSLLWVLFLSALSRPGLLVFTLLSLALLPCLGIYGLWDPWETHYGEVAREILSRDDWISLWWAHEEWFWSKPIFIFWSEALCMMLFGWNFHPNAGPGHPEWAVRMPHYILAITTCIVVYHAVQRRFGKRTGFITAMVLGTLPHFFMLSHQAITDMPFVSNMTMAMAMLSLAITESPDTEVRAYRLGRVVITPTSAAIFAMVLFAAPQILYLVSRNVTWVEGGFAWHRDRFNLGSAGNGGNPGNPAIRELEPAFNSLFEQPMTQAMYWTVGLVLVLLWLRKERKLQGIYMFGFYLFCTFSFMAKTLPGLVIPAVAAFFYLIGSRRWDLLTEGRFRIGVGLLVVATVGWPWYIAMYVRHGKPFVDRLFIHDQVNRLTAGVHGDNGSIQYFMEQLGFALFPWVALVPLAIGGWIALHRARKADAVFDAEADKRKQLMMLFGLWGTSAFTLFSAMTTKFHHYIFPAVPSVGVLVGITLERMLAMSPRGTVTGEAAIEASSWHTPNAKRLASIVCAAIAPTFLVLAIGNLAGSLRGIVPAGVASGEMRDWVPMHPGPMWLSALFGLLAVVAFAAAFVLGGGMLKNLRDPSQTSLRWAGATSGLLAAPLLVGLVGRDLSWANSRPYGFERMIHLFVYQYERHWPEQFDYRAILTGFAVTASVFLVIAAVRALRKEALIAFMGLAFAFCVWCLDVYLIDLAPHWSQRNMYDRYYAARQQNDGHHEPILAWLMNWKGENFYTGNRVYTFVDTDNRKFDDWIRAHQGQKVWIVTEMGRSASLHSHASLSNTTLHEELTAREQSHFVVVSGVLGRRDP